MNNKKMLVVLLITLIAAVFTSQALAAPRGEINVYTALEDDQIPRYLESFRAKYPEIKLNIVRDSTGVMTSKLLAEKENPQADVVWGLAATSLLVLDQKEMLTPYAPAGIARVADKFKDTKNELPHWVGIDAWMTGITVNTIELEKEGLPVPKSYQDLTKEIYKGKIVMPNPNSSGTGFLTVSAFLQLLGEEEAWDYMDRLHNNIAMYTHSGSQPAKIAARGEFPIGVSFGYRGIKEKTKGAPVEVIFPEKGSGWDLEANALIKKDEIKEEAKLFLDWAISQEAMKEYNKSYAITTVQTDVPVPEGFPADPLEQLIDNDFDWAARNRSDILDEWMKRYDGKSAAK